MPRLLVIAVRTGALGALLLGPPLHGQAQTLVPGDRIRIASQGSIMPLLVGTFLRATADSLWLTARGQAHPTTVALSASLHLERSMGRRSHAMTGALVGAGVGAAVTLFFLGGFCGGDTLCNGDEQLRAAAIFGLPGVGLGAGIGALIRTERWAPASIGGQGSGPMFQVGLRLGWSISAGRLAITPAAGKE
jgi:hypothetical protein